MFTVITESIGWSPSQIFVTTRYFKTRYAAIQHIADEIGEKDVLRVRCPEMDIEEVGEWC